MTDFDRAIEFVLEEEKYGNHALPGDPGGLTIWGITERWYPEDVAKMKNMTKEESRIYAKGFYEREQWKPAHCDKMEWPLNLCVLDTNVNCGPSKVSSWLTGDDWQEFLCNRVRWQIHESKSRYTVSLLNRIYRLYNTAKGG